MKPAKAIEILEELSHGFDQPLMKDEEDVVKLGIEAMKRYEDLRKYNIIPRWEKLPGETEE